MSAYTCWQGIAERLATIAGIGTIALGEPRAEGALPAFYGLYLSFDQVLRNAPPAKNLSGKEHHFAVYLVLSWVDQVAAETLLLQMIDQVTDAIDADPHLGGRLNNGAAWIDKGVSGFKAISSQYRIVQFTVTVVEKRPIGG